MDECLRERFLVVDNFLAEEASKSMRDDINSHFADPAHHGAPHQVWNYWHVPGSYTYMRTAPEKVIARDKVEHFVERLRTWAAINLGLAGITWPNLSLYVPGCLQGLHNDSVNGRLGFVYSLTRNERRTIGGETVLMHDRDLFRTLLDQPAAGHILYDLVEPRFNRLTLFDDRVPHAVQRVDGSMDPVEGRLVLHGHISEAGVVAQGALAPAASTGRGIRRACAGPRGCCAGRARTLCLAARHRRDGRSPAGPADPRPAGKQRGGQSRRAARRDRRSPLGALLSGAAGSDVGQRPADFLSRRQACSRYCLSRS